ncbi:MAG: hypothetical protein AAGJ19_22065 [Myxococcota bacterium]
MRFLAVDPGSTESAYVIAELEDDALVLEVQAGIVDNVRLREQLPKLSGLHRAIFEFPSTFGSQATPQVLETCFWVGVFTQAISVPSEKIDRRTVKATLLGSARGSDAEIRQVLLRRWGGDRDAAHGTKAKPGPLYGFKADLWAALAVAEAYAEVQAEKAETEIKSRRRRGHDRVIPTLKTAALLGG